VCLVASLPYDRLLAHHSAEPHLVGALANLLHSDTR
jgi:hypothetical protein